ncbi:MAG TPA: GtrA family protein [Steroidobacteraceae bacterium]|nr:GtrA family protein [Steroidobacteraceae bacterium]
MAGVDRTVAEILSFTVIGGAGFVVDTSVLYAALYLGLGLYAGRVISYLAAVTFTWALNSRYTFKQRATDISRFRQWQRFAVSQLSGAVINLGVYGGLVRMSRYCAEHPVIGVAVGSLMGLMANYLAARRFVFRER